jgi:DNA-binding transcriptional LysR family regulator
MKFDQLRNLIAAGRTGSIRQAARDLNLSQPAVTKSIKLLEEELGCSLLHRQSHGVIPTASGEALIKRALSIETELNNARNEIDKIEGVTTGDIRVSASPSVAINLMPRAILNLKKSRPNVTVHIEELVYPHVLPAVRSGELDMAVCLMPHGLDADDLDVEVLLEDSLTPAVRSDHHLARKQKLSLKELLDEEWVIFGRRGESRDIYEQTFRQNGLEAPRSTIECTSQRVADQAVILADADAALDDRRHNTRRYGAVSGLPGLSGRVAQIHVAVGQGAPEWRSRLGA